MAEPESRVPAAAEGKPNAKIDVEVRTAGMSVGGSLLDSALYNLNIAQQYIDETEYLAEHRLISFHHGVALLARYRSDSDKLAVAHQCLSDAANWQIDASDWNKLGGSYLQIVGESHYNLGVIEELRGNFDRAIDHYSQAIAVDQRMAELDIASKKETRPTGVEILAKFGKISASMSLMKRMRWGTKNERVLPSFSSKYDLSKEAIRAELKRLQYLIGKELTWQFGAPMAKPFAEMKKSGAKPPARRDEADGLDAAERDPGWFGRLLGRRATRRGTEVDTGSTGSVSGRGTVVPQSSSSPATEVGTSIPQNPRSANLSLARIGRKLEQMEAELDEFRDRSAEEQSVESA